MRFFFKYTTNYVVLMCNGNRDIYQHMYLVGECFYVYSFISFFIANFLSIIPISSSVFHILFFWTLVQKLQVLTIYTFYLVIYFLLKNLYFNNADTKHYYFIRGTSFLKTFDLHLASHIFWDSALFFILV